MDRFWSKVKVRSPKDCWEWQAAVDIGYGRFWYGRRMVLAHRFSYELVHGKIPDGLEIDHLCRNKSCVNPNHLEAVSHSENRLRDPSRTAPRSKKLSCSRGHPYNKQNTYVGIDGKRRCRACTRIATRKSNSRKAALLAKYKQLPPEKNTSVIQ